MSDSTAAFTGTIGINSDSVFIGCDRNGTNLSYFFNGYIDNLRLWHVARNESEIQQNMYIPLQARNPSGKFAGLMATYLLDWDAWDWSGMNYNTGNVQNVSFFSPEKQISNNFDFNCSLVLDGNSYCAAENNSDFNPVTALTLEAWIKRDTTGILPAQEFILNKSGGTNRWNYALYIQSGILYFVINDGSLQVFAPLPYYTNQRWTHIAGTYSSVTGLIKLFINGDSVASNFYIAKPTIQNNSDSLYIGGVGASSYEGSKFKGQIDEIRIWKDSVISTNTIISNMYKTISSNAGTNLNCVYNFDNYTNYLWTSNGGINGNLKFRGNAFISSSHTQNDLYPTSPLLLDWQSQFYSTNYFISTRRFAIPDNNISGITDSIYVAKGGGIAGIKVFTLVNHSNVSNLRMSIISPGGTTVNLLPTNNLGTYAGNDIITIFDEEEDSTINLDGNGILPPFSPRIKPAGSITGFELKEMKGWWKLIIEDRTVGHIGFVNGWGIRINPIGGLFSPDKLSLNSPINLSTNQPVNVTLKWFKSERALQYKLQVATDSLFSNLVYNDSTLTDSLKQMSVLRYGKKYYWRVAGKNDAGSSEWSDVWNFSTTNLCKSITIVNGWNMLAVPVLLTNMSKTSLFPTATSGAYSYLNGYVTSDTLRNGTGYWIKFSSDQTVNLCGSDFGISTVPVLTSWNLIGVYDKDIPVSNVASTPPGILTSSFYGYNNGYFVADTLKVGKGYWVKTNQTGVLNLPSLLLENNVVKNKRHETGTELTRSARLTVKDNSGKEITLYLSNEALILTRYELPPIPPLGIFDARFTSDRFVESLDESKTIKLQSSNYPIKIKVEGIELTIKDNIDGRLIDKLLKNGDELIIENSNINSLILETINLPLMYQLYQNFPNPFNPSTTIKFDLPRASKVNLSIYNVLGEKISELINQELVAGQHKVEWNASNFSSGIYFYSVSANDFHSAKKMMVVK